MSNVVFIQYSPQIHSKFLSLLKRAQNKRLPPHTLRCVWKAAFRASHSCSRTGCHHYDNCYRPQLFSPAIEHKFIAQPENRWSGIQIPSATRTGTTWNLQSSPSIETFSIWESPQYRELPALEFWWLGFKAALRFRTHWFRWGSHFSRRNEFATMASRAVFLRLLSNAYRRLWWSLVCVGSVRWHKSRQSSACCIETPASISGLPSSMSDRMR